MTSAAGATGNRHRVNPRLLPAIDRLLLVGMKLGRAGQHQAVARVLQLVPEWKPGDCWRRIRYLGRTAVPDLTQAALSSDKPKRPPNSSVLQRSPSRPWTSSDDEKLLNWAGYEPVKKISQRLGRSEPAVRFRLGALGMSAKVSDGWSLRSLRKLLRVSPTKIRYFIATGMLRVRDARVTANSLLSFCQENLASLVPEVVKKVTALAESREAYSWERAADLLGVQTSQVQNWILRGQLRIVDTFVTDRSFEEFCRNHGDQINLAFVDPSTAQWLVQEYGVPASVANGSTVGRARKHVLIVRTCECGRKIAGNVYFKHAKTCKADQAIRHARLA